ncbi:glycosyltransferase [Methanolobus mangrovi]|uniref:Glycosyltransferase n=1 Tax=Methanolobus mangrovi TaxID=3072977 RepID=A0AA51UH98_9EURY|nr:glycosyltransferase [Methanolobus mangrovi]WMW23232.1 glycosyltransferase [Methanolobus mangrovi]
MNKIEVTIVVPTFNRANSISDTIESLCNQTYPHEKYEIIISDDSTTDETYKLVNQLIQEKDNNIRYIHANSITKGPANARNVGIENASGKLIGFTDDDCIVSNDWVKKAVDVFDMSTKDISGLYGKVTTIGNCKSRYRISREVSVENDDGSYVTPNVFYKKDVLLDVGCFDVTQRYLEDIELGWRVENVGEILFCPSLKVNHKILCLSIKDYISRLKVIEYWVMMHSKHPNHIGKGKYIHKRMQSMRPLYIVSSFIAILSLIYSAHYAYLIVGMTLLLYSFQYVFFDQKVQKYPKRLLKFPVVYIVDLMKLYYSTKGSIKYKYFMMY